MPYIVHGIGSQKGHACEIKATHGERWSGHLCGFKQSTTLASFSSKDSGRRILGYHSPASFAKSGLSVIIQMLHLTNMLRSAYLFSLAIFLARSLSAQENPSFTSRANLVPIPTLVRDAEGNAVYGLHAEDFIIEDDAVQQTVHLDVGGGPSGSLGESARWPRCSIQF